MRKSNLILFLSLFLFLSAIAQFVPEAFAQEAPDKRFLFMEDKRKKKEKRAKGIETKKRQKKALKEKESGERPFELSAKNLGYDAAKKRVTADGGLVLSYSDSVIEAQTGSVGTEERDVSVSGDVRISDITGDLSASSADLNLKSGEGKLFDADILFTDGDYRISAGEVAKKGTGEYELKDTRLTTCDCPDDSGCLPWEIDASEASFTRNGYAEVWDAVIRAGGVPVFYTPYLIFPAKTERQSGFLPMMFNSGRRQGAGFQLPFFWAINGSTDATITSVYDSNARTGAQTEFRKLFSSTHQLEAGLTYLNEAQREGKLLGTDISGLADPALDENRFAGYTDYLYRTELFNSPSQVLVQGKYVSDDLLLREFPSEKIEEYNARYVSSRALARTTIFSSHSLEAAAEYNQSMITPDEVVFQRIPEFTLAGSSTFRPFGENPLGAKLILSDNVSSVNFLRDQGFDGWRSEVREKLKLPFHLQNYLDAELLADVRATKYVLNDNFEPTFDAGGQPILRELPKESDRIVPTYTAQMGTVLERVFQVPQESFLKTIADMGMASRSEELVRMKHTIEPTLKYRLVPMVDQLDNPQFDSNDRLARRKLVTYELTQRLYGRNEPRDAYLYGLEETAPEIADLGSLSTMSPIDQNYDYGMESLADDFKSTRFGSKRELLRFKIAQSFDIIEESEDLNPDRGPLSDLGFDLTLLPNEYVKFNGKSTVDTESSDFTSYQFSAQLQSKRGDELRARMNFIDPTVRQLESSINIGISDSLRLGYYSLFDDLEGEFISNKIGARYLSSCNCWSFDIRLEDRTNPDETRLSFNINLVGLGEFGNSFFSQGSNQSTQGN